MAAKMLKEFRHKWHILTHTENEHCTTQDTIQITFHALPESIDLGQDTTLCERSH
ncbi:MAG: hypothetical protein IPP49_16295 [Saprospiraceae bacterium]|nr:hypothetical protein [Saprospiraceae bacterium]